MNVNEKFHTVRGYQLLDQNIKHLTPAMEDYLEMIYRNSLEEGYIRISTLSELLSVKPSSTTNMVQRLAELNMIDYKKYGIIILTKEGREIGEYLLKRHEVIETFLKYIGIESELQQVELMEHDIDGHTMENINLLNLFLKNNSDILDSFRDFQEDYYKKVIKIDNI